MELFLETFEVADDDRRRRRPRSSRWSRRTTTSSAVDVRRRPRSSMRTDLTKLRQILFNLLSQRRKFTENGTHHVVRANAGDRGGATSWSSASRDTGIGIPEEQLGQRLRGVPPGRRVDHAQVRRHRPRPRDHPALLRDDGRRRHASRARSARAPRSRSGCPRTSVPADDGRGGSAPAPPRLARQRGPRPVLVIDDDPDARDLMGRSLRAGGFQVVTASDGDEGLRLAKNAAARGDHARRHDARHGRLGGAEGAQGRPRDRATSRRHGDDDRRQGAWGTRSARPST